MMNWTDDALSLGTLAHELGHSMHSFYTWRSQPFVYARYSMFAAEVASNLNQALVGAHLLETSGDRDFKVAVIEERMSNHLRYLFTMPILARFELEIHERVERGEALTADSMSELLVGLYREGFGDAVEIDPPRQGIIWAEFPHLFTPFYVFQYATGIAAAGALASQILEEGEPAARRYREFLAAGDSAFPIDALRRAGIDMTQPEPVQRAFDDLDALVTRLDHLTR
jgi:oligoendopeptidase F